MAIPTFVQKSRINEVIFQLRDGRLLISERRFLGKFEDRELDLRWVDPDYKPGIARNHTAVIIFLLLATISGAAVWGVLHQTVIPKEAVFYVVQWPAVLFVVFLASAVRWSRRIEYYAFKNKAGHLVLVIFREPNQAKECAAFITTLVAQIEIAQGELPAADRSRLLHSVGADRSFIQPTVPGLALWKIALVLGALATGLPLIPNADYLLAGFLFPIVFICCAGGVSLCFFSFSANEPRRWWSLIGAILSLIPPLFYN